MKVKPKHFETGSYAIWALTALSIPTLFKNKRDFWYLLIGGSLLSPFEWISDYHVLFMTYSDEFKYLISRKFIPLFMFFAYGWFFSTTLMVNFQFEKKLDSMPLWKQIMLMYAVYFVWDFSVEFPATKVGFWKYYSNVKKIGTLPFHVPIGMAAVNTCLYYVHKFARKRSDGKNFLQGLAIHAASYWSFLGFGALIGMPLLKKFGQRPEWPDDIDLPRFAARPKG